MTEQRQKAIEDYASRINEKIKDKSMSCDEIDEVLNFFTDENFVNNYSGVKKDYYSRIIEQITPILQNYKNKECTENS